jgi:hypothetical protein
MPSGVTAAEACFCKLVIQFDETTTKLSCCSSILRLFRLHRLHKTLTGAQLAESPVTFGLWKPCSTGLHVCAVLVRLSWLVNFQRYATCLSMPMIKGAVKVFHFNVPEFYDPGSLDIQLISAGELFNTTSTAQNSSSRHWRFPFHLMLHDRFGTVLKIGDKRKASLSECIKGRFCHLESV